MKKILFIFMLMVLLIPFQIKAEEESALGIDYSVVGGMSIFAFGDGHYLKIPLDIVVTTKDFDVLKIIETDIDHTKLKVEYLFDLEKDNNVKSQFTIKYKDKTIYTPVYIDIKNYINVNEEIIVNDNNFDIWNYIDTNILDKESIEIIGTYDVNTNGKYEITLKYDDIVKNTTVVVDIKENIKEDKKEEVLENESSTCEKMLTSETNNYTNKYYTYNTYNNEEILETVSCPEINIPTPINKTIYNDKSTNDYFYYITYVFYALVVMLLSINVVRKK